MIYCKLTKIVVMMTKKSVKGSEAMNPAIWCAIAASLLCALSVMFSRHGTHKKD